MEVRLITGRPFDEFGPAHVWLRFMVPLFSGEEIHPLDRAFVCGDYANGMSNVVSFKTHLYLDRYRRSTLAGDVTIVVPDFERG